MSGIHLLMINPNDGSELVPEDVFRYNVPDKFQMGKERLSGEVIECSLKELTGVDETFMICQVCFEIIDRPTTLPCLHAFCTKCLFDCVGDFGKVCPLCKQDFECPVTSLPKNSFIYHYMCIALVAQEIDSAPCKVCKLKPDEYCVHCDAYLCELCSIVCHKMNGKDHHNVMRLLKYKQIIVEKSPDCVHHCILATDFCETCKDLVCKKCIRESHNQHSLKDVQSGVAYFKKTTDDLVNRYPYEDSLLYKMRKARGLPLKDTSQKQPKRIEGASAGLPIQKCCKKTLSLSEIEQLKKELANKTLPSRLSADKTVRISTFQTEDMDWEVYVPIVPQPSRGAPKTRNPVPIDDGTKVLADLLHKSIVSKLGEPKKKEPIEASDSPANLLEDITRLITSKQIESNPPASVLEDITKFITSQQVEPNSPQASVLGEISKFIASKQAEANNPKAKRETEIHCCNSHAKQEVQISDSRNQDIEVKESAKAHEDKTSPVDQELDEDDVDTSESWEDGKQDGKPGGDWNEKKLKMFNHLMGKNYATPPEKPIEHYLSRKFEYIRPPLPKLEFNNIDFDDVD